LRSAQEIGAADETDDGTEDLVLRRPLQYYDNLRESNFPYQTREGSAMYRINDTDLNETVRLAHVASLNPYSDVLPDGTREIVDLILYIEASVFLALHHFNERSSEVLPHLPDLLQNCNTYMTVDILDTLLSPLVASRKAVKLLTRESNSIKEPLPLSIAGAV